MMVSSRRRFIWVTLVALAVAALLWVDAEDEGATSAPPTAPATAETTVVAPPSPGPSSDGRGDPEPPPPPDAPPTAAPLPRDQVELPSSHQAPDGGVPERDPTSADEQRDDMMTTVLERLSEDLRDAEEAGEDERAAQLRVRIERLEARRRELTEP